MERVGALGGGRCPGADDGGDVAGAVGRDVGQGRGPVRAQRAGEAGDGFHGAAGSGPDKQAGVMIDDDDQVLVALAVGDLVDPDPPQPGQPVGAGGSLGGDPGDDVPDGPPSGAHQLADGGLGGRARQPGDGVLERAGMPGAVPGPRHGCDRHAVPGAGHPRRGAFQLGPDRAQVQGPPPAPLALVIARAAAPADPAPPGPAPVRPDPGDYRDLRLAVRPGIFLPADPLDHGAAFDSQHPRP